MVEDSKKIIEWSLSHSEELCLQVEYYTGLKTFLPNIFDLGIFIKINNEIYYGRGSDENEELAYCKALSEAIERSILKIYKLENTNGLAVHPNLESAIRNAQNELIERDAFFCHYFLSKGFFEIEIKNETLISVISSLGIDIKFYELCKNTTSTGVMCLLNGKKFSKPFGNILGTAYGDVLDEVVQKALIEALRAFVFLSKSPIPISLSLQDFMEIDEIDFSHHGKLALDLNYSKQFEGFINNNKISINSSYPQEIFENNILDPALFPIPDIPLFLVKSSSVFLQNIFTGNTTKGNVNWVRLNQISNIPIDMLSINLVPHPFD